MEDMNELQMTCFEIIIACGDSPLKEGAFRIGKASGSGAKLPVSPEPPSLREGTGNRCTVDGRSLPRPSRRQF